MGNEIKQDYPCKRTKCERHGNCAVCKEHHQNSNVKPLTTCERLEVKAERIKNIKRGR